MKFIYFVFFITFYNERTLKIEKILKMKTSNNESMKDKQNSVRKNNMKNTEMIYS